MSPRLKRILLIIGLILISALIAWGLYIMFKRASGITTLPPPVADDLRPGQLPPSGERPPGSELDIQPGADVFPPSTALPGEDTTVFRPDAVLRRNDSFISHPSVSNHGTYRYQNPNDGKFYRLGPSGDELLSDKVFFGVEKVTWAKNSDKAVLEYPDGANIVYNFATKKQITLPTHWENFSFAPDSTEIAAKSLGLAPENRWLVVTQDDGNGTRLIEPLGDNADKVTIDWSPSGQAVGFTQTGRALGLDRREVLFVGLNNENFKSITVEGLNFLPQWSPSGRHLLYSVDSARTSFKPELWIVDSFGDNIGRNRETVGLLTWADKCAFAGEDTLFCAVPRDLPTGAGMVRDIALQTYDDLFKVDLRTGLRTNVPFGDYVVQKISYDQVGNKLYFTDNLRTGVHEVNL